MVILTHIPTSQDGARHVLFVYDPSLDLVVPGYNLIDGSMVFPCLDQFIVRSGPDASSSSSRSHLVVGSLRQTQFSKICLLRSIQL